MYPKTHFWVHNRRQMYPNTADFEYFRFVITILITLSKNKKALTYLHRRARANTYIIMKSI